MFETSPFLRLRARMAVWFRVVGTQAPQCPDGWPTPSAGVRRPQRARPPPRWKRAMENLRRLSSEDGAVYIGHLTCHPCLQKPASSRKAESTVKQTGLAAMESIASNAKHIS